MIIFKNIPRNEVARIVKRTRATVDNQYARALKLIGEGLAKKHFRFTEETNKHIKYLHDKGIRLSKIARKFGIPLNILEERIKLI